MTAPTVSADIGAILSGIAALLAAIATFRAGKARASVDSVVETLNPERGRSLTESLKLVDDKVDMLAHAVGDYQRENSAALTDIRLRLTNLESRYRANHAIPTRKRKR